MNSGLYSALSGSISALQRFDTTANNLSNVNTVGFKKNKSSFETLVSSLEGTAQIPAGKTADPLLSRHTSVIDYSDGLIERDSNRLHMAIQGPGFFVFETPDGPVYSRQGVFTRDSEDNLISIHGYTLVGKNGPVQIKGNVENVVIDEKGKIFVNEQAAGEIRLVDFEKPYKLSQYNGMNTHFVPLDKQEPVDAVNSNVIQGSIENSNVDFILESSNIIEITRYYESCSKVLKMYDDVSSKAANELGKV